MTVSVTVALTDRQSEETVTCQVRYPDGGVLEEVVLENPDNRATSFNIHEGVSLVVEEGSAAQDAFDEIDDALTTGDPGDSEEEEPGDDPEL